MPFCLRVVGRRGLAAVAAAAAGSGCIPHLYSHGSDETGVVDTAPCSWSAPTNTWPVTGPEGCLASTGWDVGDVPADVHLTDQFGDTVSLWQFYGNVVLFDVSTMWCGPCRTLGAHTEETWQDFKDRGFVYVTVLQQDNDSDPARLDDIQEWVEAFGITAPVLADPEARTMGAVPQIAGNPAFPGVLLIDRTMKIVDEVGTSEAEVRDAIQKEL